MKAQRSYARKSLVATALILVLVAGCINPFQTSYEEPSTSNTAVGTGYSTLTVNSGGIGAATIAPNLGDIQTQIDSYTLTLTNTVPGSLDPIEILNYVQGSPVEGIPIATEWTISLIGLNLAGEIVAEGVPDIGNPVSFPDPSPVNVNITLQPLIIGAGELSVTLDWAGALGPGIEVDEIEVNLYSFATGQEQMVLLTAGTPSAPFINPDVSDSAVATANFAGNSLALADATMGSGSYRLTMTLFKGTGAARVAYAPVIEAVQIYDNLVSSGTINLGAGDLTSPPEPPSDIVVEFTAENTFNVYWTDNSNTEEGFRVYEDGGGILATLLSGATSAEDLSFAGFGGTPLQRTLEIASYNSFGESERIAFTFMVLPFADAPEFNPGTNTNSESWASSNEPGSIGWGQPLIPAGLIDETELYLDESEAAVTDPLDLSELALDQSLGPAGTLIELSWSDLHPYTPGTYYWRVQGIGAAGNEGRVIYPMQEFTVRNDIIYVSESSGSPAGPGSADEPLDSITDAIQLALPGEVIRIAEGVYDGGFTVNKSLTLDGNWNTSFTDQDAVAHLTTVTSPTPVATTVSIAGTGVDATIRNMRIELDNATVATNFAALTIEANATIEDADISVVRQDLASESYAVLVTFNAGAVTIRRNRISLAETPDVPTAAGIAIVGTYTGTLWIGGDNLGDGNQFVSGTAAGINSHIWGMVGTPATTPNINVRNNTFEGLVSSATSTRHSIYSQGNAVNWFIEDNTFFGHQNTNDTPLWAVRIFSDGETLVQRNIFDFDHDLESLSRAIDISGNTGEVTVNANRILMHADGTNTNRGIEISRPGALITNNVIVQTGSTASTGPFSAIWSESADAQIFHNTLVNKNRGVAADLINLVDGENQTITNNLLVGLGTPNPTQLTTGIQVAGTNLIDAIQSNWFFGVDILLENNVGGAFAEANAGSLNGQPFANDNIDTPDPELNTLVTIDSANWFRSTLATVPTGVGTTGVIFDVNDDARGAPPRIGAHE